MHFYCDKLLVAIKTGIMGA